MWEPLQDGFVYQMPPIDWWTAWDTVDEALSQIDPTERDKFRAELDRIIRHAQGQFKRRSLWEGDIVTGPFVAGLPPDDGNADGDVMVAIKQENNGTVFVWSPYELGWLDQYKS